MGTVSERQLSNNSHWILNFRYRVTSTTHHIFRSIIPEPHNRKTITWRALPLPLYALLGLLFLAYLSRRPNTRFLRMLVLPTVILSALGFSFGYVWTEPIFNVYNWAQCESVCPARHRLFITMIRRPLGRGHCCESTGLWLVQER